jgi:hypothetical protein
LEVKIGHGVEDFVSSGRRLLQEMSLKKLEMKLACRLFAIIVGPNLGEDLSESMVPRDLAPLLCDENLMMSKNVGSSRASWRQCPATHPRNFTEFPSYGEKFESI